MTTVTPATPLLSLDAVSLDTETTGLDLRKARLLEVGAVRIESGRLDGAGSFRQLINPGEPIPAFSTAIHGIDNEKVAGAPSFANMWPQLSAFIGDAVIIGHTVGFDLAMMAQECRRAGLTFEKPRSLDTQFLAQLINPRLTGQSLGQLADWLGVEVTDRHSALGDALTTARVFQAMVPKLREGGIRTYAEAAQACRSLTDVMDRQYRAGWMTADSVRERDSQPVPSRIDSYPYRHRIRDVMSSPPKTIAAERTLGEALAQLIEARISSLLVVPPGVTPEKLPAYSLGIITERDVMRALAIEGEGALKLGIEQFMSRPLATIPAEAFVYRAIGRMSRLKIRHLGVIDEAGLVIGALSARDLLRLRAEEAVSLGDEIDEAEDVHALGAAWAKLPQVATSLLGEDIGAVDVAAIVSRELGALTRKASVIAEQRLREAGLGDPPCPYAVAVLGSAGRGESLLAMDQDNAIVFERGDPGGAEDRYFAALGGHLADILNDVGVPYCKGGVMAKNDAWRGSVATWQDRVTDWIARSRPQDLMAVDIFFDLRGVHGELGIADRLWRYAYDAAKGKVEFAKLLVEAAGGVERGIGLFGRLRAQKGRIDLKMTGLFGIVSTARSLSIRHHILERATPARLRGVRSLRIGGETDLDRLIEAQAVFLDFILAQQLADVHAGRPATNAVSVRRLTAAERERLKTALQAMRHLDELTRDLLFKD
jgi:DNA polymerase-3 subunit epsilon/CBS domain-containing protein